MTIEAETVIAATESLTDLMRLIGRVLCNTNEDLGTAVSRNWKLIHKALFSWVSFWYANWQFIFSYSDWQLRKYLNLDFLPLHIISLKLCSHWKGMWTLFNITSLWPEHFLDHTGDLFHGLKHTVSSLMMFSSRSKERADFTVSKIWILILDLRGL